MLAALPLEYCAFSKKSRNNEFGIWLSRPVRLNRIVGRVAPVSQQFAEHIQADAYAANAPQGVEVVKGWLGS